MKVDGKPTRTIWLEPDGWSVGVIDQTALPHRYVTARLTSLAEAAHAIRAMVIRGAPLIGATAAYGMCAGAARGRLRRGARARLRDARCAARPTAINLRWALDEMRGRGAHRPRAERTAAAYRRAAEICDEDVAINEAIGRHGLPLIEAVAARKKPGEPVQRAHPLQRRLARHGRRGHRHGADLPGARRGHRRSRLGRRDAAAQPGRFAHRVGARPARRAAHA